MTPADDIYQRALQLPYEDRAELAHQLMLSLEPDGKGEGFNEAWRAELERRIKAYEDGTETAIPWQESIERMRRRSQKGKEA